jgi:hypothetical protein
VTATSTDTSSPFIFTYSTSLGDVDRVQRVSIGGAEVGVGACADKQRTPTTHAPTHVRTHIGGGGHGCGQEAAQCKLCGARGRDITDHRCREDVQIDPSAQLEYLVETTY